MNENATQQCICDNTPYRPTNHIRETLNETSKITPEINNNLMQLIKFFCHSELDSESIFN